jgi:hypothetical protein
MYCSPIIGVSTLLERRRRRMIYRVLNMAKVFHSYICLDNEKDIAEAMMRKLNE